MLFSKPNEKLKILTNYKAKSEHTVKKEDSSFTKVGHSDTFSNNFTFLAYHLSLIQISNTLFAKHNLLAGFQKQPSCVDKILH